MRTFQLWVKVVRWYDGDTFYGVLDHGCRIYTGREDKMVRFRCAEINAPELSTPEGINARDYAIELVPPGEYPCISTTLDEYGRPLLELVLGDKYFSEAMIAAGQAVRYKR